MLINEERLWKIIAGYDPGSPERPLDPITHKHQAGNSVEEPNSQTIH